MRLEKYTMGCGDRFTHQGKAQLEAFIKAKQAGIEVTPVWNKSHREHTIIGTDPNLVRKEADEATSAKGWNGAYYVDADHIGLGNVDIFLAASDFYTLDVADFTGQAAEAASVAAFVKKYASLVGELTIPGIADPLEITEAKIRTIAKKYLLAVQEAGKIYRHILEKKGEGNFIAEVSMDETDSPQTPEELLFILAAIADEGIPAQTIAPKFTGRFNKGVDYVGDVEQFNKEFDEDICVIAYAVKEFGLPDNLKLSVHSGSDKFSIYPGIRAAIRKYDAGLHLKTAGTTWLEELIGLAEAGGEGLEIAREVYRTALKKYDELVGPYAAVIDIDTEKLPAPDEVDAWTGEAFAKALRHDQSESAYNQHFRQLLHVGYKVAAQMGERYINALKKYEDEVAKHVCENLLERHIKRVF